MGEDCHVALRFTPSIMGQAETDRKPRPPLACESHLSFKGHLRIGSQGGDNWVGRGAGFRDFLCLPSAKENRRTLPASVREGLTLTPRITEGWGKTEAGRSQAEAGLFLNPNMRWRDLQLREPFPEVYLSALRPYMTKALSNSSNLSPAG